MMHPMHHWPYCALCGHNAGTLRMEPSAAMVSYYTECHGVEVSVSIARDYMRTVQCPAWDVLSELEAGLVEYSEGRTRHALRA